MSRSLKIILSIVSLLIPLALLGGLVWANTAYARSQPIEKDFLVPWLGARTFLQYGNSPYSDPAAQRAQIQYYGHPAAKGEDPLKLAAPFPVELFYFPLAIFGEYALAWGVWSTCLEIALGLLSFLCLRLTGWMTGRGLLAAMLLFSIFWIYGIPSVFSGSGVALVALAIVGGLLSLKNERDELAGALFVLPFFRLDVSGVFLIFIMGWTIYHRRWKVWGGFLMTFVLLLVISFIVLPTWFVPFLRGLISHMHYVPVLTPGRIFSTWWPGFGDRLGWILTGGLIILLPIEWWVARRKEFRHVLWVISLTLAATPLMGIPFSPFDHVLLFIPLTMALSILAERWSRRGQAVVVGIPLFLIFAFPWLMAFTGKTSGALIALLSLGMPGLLLLFIYWMRWWAIHPPRTWLETIKEKL